MVRKYPERIAARMTRIINQDEVLLIRQNTKIKFGSSDAIIGTVFMTNPGSFDFKHTKGWADFKSGKGLLNVLETEDYADLTMQNLIEVIREGYKHANLGSPDGIVQIFNISNVVQSKGEEAEDYHKKVRVIIEKSDVQKLALIQDIVAVTEQEFLKACVSSRFVIMGFVNNVFTENVSNLIKWSRALEDRLVVAKDEKSRYSHPRRWRTEKNLKELAINEMCRALNKNY
ncbi:hypothetical protein [Rossellomorea aquimaris]|uniref:Uncharacterized protein n=1 Tax=Rossellomorea aquimaris TaxID=189382 RepID=A0A366ERM0_9BACI|nr:hypothetical protein [Rossellomorea aquimaris]RBP04954.1 hypothetical protein DET59_105244 [Rossellomorea aquimaris]